ncbi:MAG: hypothetical protein D6E12_15465 [Desulfovibrio sp.]|nr:MAG: hypothetical protein D6E12_15465 [Desulfovibrio sp.]
MSDMESFSDGLIRETLVDMADTFFGARKDLEDEIAGFTAQAEKLKAQGDQALALASVLHALLLSEENAYDLYYELGVRPRRLLLWVDPAQARACFPMPRKLTGSGRYQAAVLRAYDMTQTAFHEYLHGHYFSDPRTPGRKRLSMHFELLQNWAGHINRRIRRVNESLAPSCVLGFAKSMDVAALDKERITGATLEGSSCDLDQDLAFSPISCFELGVKQLPELPPLAQAKKILLRNAAKIYSEDRTLARQALEHMCK